MATQYLIKLALTLRPVWHQDPPLVRLGIDDNLTELYLRDTTTINFEFVANQASNLIVEFLNKTDEDTVADQGLDKAVIIEQISFFGIADPKFVWTGIYRPCYPEPWATQQRNQGTVLPDQLTNQTYLGWNGKWTLTFDVPVFTWIHNLQNLGWIYG